MKNKLFYLLLLAFVAVIPVSLFAQDWVTKMNDHNVNFYDVQKSFNKFYAKNIREMERERKRKALNRSVQSNDEETEISGYSQYKRWEWFMQPRVSPTGERFNPSQVWNEMANYKKQYPQKVFAGNWTFIGPSVTSALAGAGRLNFVRVDPSNANNLYVGSPSGGLWQSTNGGTSWSTYTDNLNHVIGCSDIAIDPTNSNVLYLATGDIDHGDNYAVGLLKSTDGGLTWNTTGLSVALANYRLIGKVLVNSNNTNIIVVATTGGIYRSTDAAATFTQVQTGSFKDMEYKPGDPNIVYACGTEFYKSTDAGQTWVKITTGLPAVANVSRMIIATTNADPNYVYLAASLPAPNYGTEGFYKSTNSGAGFSKISTPPTGLGATQQQWYDFAIAASPTNSQEIAIAGQTIISRSTNGGVSWTDFDPNGDTHVDYHDLVYASGTSVYVTNDGGIYHTTNGGGTWTNLNHNLAISQMYGFGQSASNSNLLINGWQDNGTNIYDGTWNQTMGGDGMLAFISKTNDNNMWGSQYEGSLNRSTNGGTNWSPITGITETGAWVTPWIEDPITSNTLWAGFINVWKSTNGGATWTKKSTFGGTATLNEIAVSPADNNVVWTANGTTLYKTSNGGTSWSTISTVPSGEITGIACSNTDANKAWITYSGFSNINKVFQTNDQGATWINLSASIPNIPVNCITYLDNSNEALYIGTDAGIFYKDASTNVWQPFFNGLPNVIVTQLAIYYPTGKIRASTFGRGMWESDLYVPGSYPPAAVFGSDKKIACPGAAVQFTDYSAGQPTSWNWSFPGGIPSTSNLQSPVVSYNTSGNFPVTLTVSNANGTDSTTYTDFIVISSSPYAAPTTTGAIICGPGVANLSASGSGLGTLRWWDAPGGGNLVATGPTYSPTINQTTAFYVDEDFPAGAPDLVGEYSYTFGTGAIFTANDIRGLYFDVIDPIVLNTVDVYSNTAGNRTIEIIDAQGNMFVDTTIFIPANPTNPFTVNLNFTIYPGTGYFIKFRGLVDCYRNASGAIYPYLSTSVNLTGTNAGAPGYYYFFYNWNYTTITCNTGRAQCLATDTCSFQGFNELPGNSSIDVYPNPNKGIFNLKFNTQTKDNYNLKITNAIGEIVYTEKLNSFAGEFEEKIDVGNFGAGVYTLSISNSGGAVVRKLIVY